jgi:hypothetical protein
LFCFVDYSSWVVIFFCLVHLWNVRQVVFSLFFLGYGFLLIHVVVLGMA